MSEYFPERYGENHEVRLTPEAYEVRKVGERWGTEFDTLSDAYDYIDSEEAKYRTLNGSREHSVTITLYTEAYNEDDVREQVRDIFARAYGPEIPWIRYEIGDIHDDW